MTVTKEKCHKIVDLFYKKSCASHEQAKTVSQNFFVLAKKCLYSIYVELFFIKKGRQTCDTVSLTEAGNLPRVEQAAVWGRDIADSLQNTVLQASIKTTFEKC